MKLFPRIMLLGGAVLLSLSAAGQQAAFPVEEGGMSWTDFRGHLAQNCFDCHGGFLTEGGIDLVAQEDESSVAQSPELWENVVQALRIHYMPPLDHRELPMDEREAMIRTVDARLLAAARESSPDHAMVRRLNREEFSATVNDLLMVDFPVRDRLPPDDTGYGFDNNADVLSVSPLLMEKYLDVAADAAEWALPQASDSREIFFPGDQLENRQNGAWDGAMHVNSSGPQNAARLSFEPLAPGRYRITPKLFADQAGDELARARVLVRGEELAELEVPGDDLAQVTDEAFEFRVDGPGKVPIAIEFVNDYYRKETPDAKSADRNLRVAGLLI
ncbi:MAG: DUF1587 domain-containing protein, partial [Puniceicoccales bacterium]